MRHLATRDENLAILCTAVDFVAAGSLRGCRAQPNGRYVVSFKNAEQRDSCWPGSHSSTHLVCPAVQVYGQQDSKQGWQRLGSLRCNAGTDGVVLVLSCFHADMVDAWLPPALAPGSFAPTSAAAQSVRRHFATFLARLPAVHKPALFDFLGRNKLWECVYPGAQPPRQQLPAPVEQQLSAWTKRARKHAAVVAAPPAALLCVLLCRIAHCMTVSPTTQCLWGRAG